MGVSHIPADLQAFTRITPVIHDARLILEAPSQRERRALLMAIKNCRSMVRAHVHLTPQAKANKTMVYFQTRRYPVGLEDRGDIICVHWTQQPAVNVRIEMGRTAGEVEECLGTFLGARPRNARPAHPTTSRWPQQPRRPQTSSRPWDNAATWRKQPMQSPTHNAQWDTPQTQSWRKP